MPAPRNYLEWSDEEKRHRFFILRQDGFTPLEAANFAVWWQRLAESPLYNIRKDRQKQRDKLIATGMTKEAIDAYFKKQEDDRDRIEDIWEGQEWYINRKARLPRRRKKRVKKSSQPPTKPYG